MSVEAVQVKEECEWWNSAEWWEVSEAARAGLYAGHEVKRELVLGPEVLHQPIPMFTDYEATRTYSGYSHRGTSHRDHTYAKRESSPVAVRVKEEGGKWEVQGAGECFPLRDCLLRLEPTPTQDMCNNMSLTQSRTHAKESDVTTKLSVKVTAKNYECPMCQQIFTLKSQLTEHVVVHIHTATSPEWEHYTHIALVLPDQAVSGQPPSPRTYTHTQHTHTTHTQPKSKENKIYVCDVCNEQFRSPSELRKHSEHHKVSHFSCGICSRQFNQISHSQILEHRLTHTEQYLFSCTICSKQFKVLSDLKSHSWIHRSEEKTFTCEICSKQFTKSRDLKSHRLTHSKVKTYSCKTCNKQFAFPSVFKRHKRTHKGKKTLFGCDMCEEKFARLKVLKKHKLIHSGENRFGCNICKRTFAQIRFLRDHYQTHTGEKPFGCGTCGRRFSNVRLLKKHKLFHERPFSCDVCHERFARKYSFIRHMRLHAKKTKSCSTATA